VVISIIGFTVTLVGVFKSKGAAQRAEEAARLLERASVCSIQWSTFLLRWQPLRR